MPATPENPKRHEHLPVSRTPSLGPQSPPRIDISRRTDAARVSLPPSPPRDIPSLSQIPQTGEVGAPRAAASEPTSAGEPSNPPPPADRSASQSENVDPVPSPSTGLVVRREAKNTDEPPRRAIPAADDPSGERKKAVHAGVPSETTDTGNSSPINIEEMFRPTPENDIIFSPSARPIDHDFVPTPKQLTEDITFIGVTHNSGPETTPSGPVLPQAFTEALYASTVIIREGSGTEPVGTYEATAVEHANYTGRPVIYLEKGVDYVQDLIDSGMPRDVALFTNTAGALGHILTLPDESRPAYLDNLVTRLQNHSPVYAAIPPEELRTRLDTWSENIRQAIERDEDLNGANLLLIFEAARRDARMFSPEAVEHMKSLPGKKLIIMGLGHEPTAEDAFRGDTPPSDPTWQEFLAGLDENEKHALDKITAVVRHQQTDEETREQVEKPTRRSKSTRRRSEPPPSEPTSLSAAYRPDGTPSESSGDIPQEFRKIEEMGLTIPEIGEIPLFGEIRESMASLAGIRSPDHEDIRALDILDSLAIEQEGANYHPPSREQMVSLTVKALEEIGYSDEELAYARTVGIPALMALHSDQAASGYTGIFINFLLRRIDTMRIDQGISLNLQNEIEKAIDFVARRDEITTQIYQVFTDWIDGHPDSPIRAIVSGGSYARNRSEAPDKATYISDVDAFLCAYEPVSYVDIGTFTTEVNEAILRINPSSRGLELSGDGIFRLDTKHYGKSLKRQLEDAWIVSDDPEYDPGYDQQIFTTDEQARKQIKNATKRPTRRRKLPNT